MPDDGYRYELIDGALIVTPAPTPRHQTAVLELAVLLRLACPKKLVVFVAPLDVALATDTVLEPDLLVARRIDVTEKNLPAAPVLAIEVLSPSTRRIDLTLKRDRFEAAGCPSYWVIDPVRPAIVAWELRDGRYLLVADVEGDDEFVTELPYPVRFRPSDLVR
jgi:Uma2 family endonuclease